MKTIAQNYFFNKLNIKIIRDKVFVLDFENLKRITSRIIIKLLTRFIKNVTHVFMIKTSTYGFSKLSFFFRGKLFTIIVSKNLIRKAFFI